MTSEEHLQLLATTADEHDEVDLERTAFKHSEEDDLEDQVREMPSWCRRPTLKALLALS